MSKLVTVIGPVGTRSGYGSHARDIVISLLDLGYDVKTLPIRWGNTPQNALDTSNDRDNRIIEENILAGAISGINSESNLKNEQAKLSFFDIKGDLLSMLPDLSFEVNNDINYISQSCQAVIKQNNKIIGYCGEPEKSLYSQYSIKNQVFYFELMIDKITPINNLKYKKISIFPKIKRDLTILVDDKVIASDIIDAVQRKSFNYMINSKISDIFYNKSDLGIGNKSMTIEFVFQDKSCTLRDDQVNDEMEKIVFHI